MFQLLERAGQWSQVAETSQLISDIKYRLIYIFQYHRDFYHPEEDYLQVGTLAADVVYRYYLWIYFQRKLKYCSDWLELSEKLYKGRNYQRLLIQYEWMNAAGRNHRIIIKLNTLYLYFFRASDKILPTILLSQMTLICPNIYVQNLKQNIYSLHERFFF